MSLTAEKCIELTQRVTTDNERMAVLLLVAKHSDSCQFESNDLERLLNRVFRILNISYIIRGSLRVY